VQLKLDKEEKGAKPPLHVAFLISCQHWHVTLTKTVRVFTDCVLRLVLYLIHCGFLCVVKREIREEHSLIHNFYDLQTCTPSGGSQDSHTRCITELNIKVTWTLDSPEEIHAVKRETWNWELQDDRSATTL
jgi:hypothetical protein